MANLIGRLHMYVLNSFLKRLSFLGYFNGESRWLFIPLKKPKPYQNQVLQRFFNRLQVMRLWKQHEKIMETVHFQDLKFCAKVFAI